eukprot:9485296-Pyramimonas_sp.AAC.1
MARPNPKFGASSRCRHPTKTRPSRTRTRSSRKRRQTRVPAYSGLAFPRLEECSRGRGQKTEQGPTVPAFL